MKLNGKEIVLEKEISIKEFLEKRGYQIQKVAVEKNGEIIKKADYETAMISDVDTLEVVSFVGGG